MAKKKKTQSIYRTTWNSIKGQVDAKALKMCNFGSGLGPLLDKINDKVDPLYELDPIPDKSLAAVAKLVQEAQATITNYRDQVVAKHQKHPEYDESWLNLHQALRHVDEQLVDEVRDLGVDAKKLKGWLGKDQFQKRDGGGTKLEDVSHAHEVETTVKKLMPKKDDIPGILAIIAGKPLGGCFPHNASLAEEIIKQATPIRGAVDFIDKKLAGDTPDEKLARQALGVIKEQIGKISALLGADGKVLDKFLKKYVYDVLVDKIESVCGNLETSEIDSEEN